MSKVINPIMPGFYPDPSICRAKEDYYMVNSTFAYFPGVPVFHSKDLVNWEQIGSVLDRDSQVPLEGARISQGIFAPSIRFFRGRFYMITTNVSAGGNFIVTAEKPEGPWSEPHYLGDKAPGIDPSLFFDEDGACYYIGQREKPVGCKYYGDTEIWIQKLNLQTLELEGELTPVLDGFQKNAVWPEGPHLYHIGEYYYILHAESGTAFHHCVVAARSKNVFGPYEYCPCNPILTHRHLGRNYPVTCVGHADLVDDARGNWYMVVLACRPREGHTMLGRETFLAKVTWEDGWPVVNAGAGRLEDAVEVPDGREVISRPWQKRVYTFEDNMLPPEFVSMRNHRERIASLEARPGFLRLYMREATLRELSEPAYLAVRWRHMSFEAQTCFQADFAGGDGLAGMALVQDHENHVRAEYFQENGTAGIRVVQCIRGADTCLSKTADACAGEMGMRFSVHGLSADLWYNIQEGWESGWRLLAENIDLRPMSTESAGGFVGCTVGMYASGNGQDAGGFADFERFIYSGSEEE